jgi:hypothetical protein
MSILQLAVIRGPFRIFVLSSNESNKTKKKQCDSKTKRMRTERADIERERMQAYREMPVTKGKCICFVIISIYIEDCSMVDAVVLFSFVTVVVCILV